MTWYIARRLLQLIPVLLGVTVITFVISHSVPADPVALYLGPQGSGDPATVAAFEAKWGLNQSLPVQYWDYMTNLFHGNLGQSIFTQQPVLADLGRYFPATIELASVAIVITVVVSVPLGIIAAVKAGSVFDSVIRTITLVGSSLPVFWLALVLLQVFYVKLGIAAAPGRLDATASAPAGSGEFYLFGSLFRGDWATFGDALGHLILPAIVLSTWSIGVITRVTRTSMLTSLNNDFMRTAKAKGASGIYAVVHHALPNALLPILTLTGLAFADLMAGAVTTETIFAFPGIGMYAYNAATNLDFSAIMGVALLVCVVYLLTNLTVDILYGVIDRRAQVTA